MLKGYEILWGYDEFIYLESDHRAHREPQSRRFSVLDWLIDQFEYEERKDYEG